jgi:hypothetical protein
MKTINRDHCAITGHADLEHLYTFPNFPVFMGCLNQSKDLDLKNDMSWWISKSSGLIQLKELLPLEVLYPESHGAGAIGKLWEKHHACFAKFVNKFSQGSIFEIGGAHGILEKESQQFEYKSWTILEPNPSPIEGSNAKFIKGFFDQNFTYTETFDTLVHSHVFEHIYEPDKFMKHLSSFVDQGKRLIFSVPNMQVMLERKYTNCINFEHTVFLTESYIEFLLAQFGFKLDAKEYFMEDHSIFYAAIRDNSVKPFSLPINLFEKNKKLFKNYINYHKELIEDLNHKISKITSPIYLFGAHIFSQCLLAMGLQENNIVCLLDNDPNKNGRRLYGTSLKVESPQILAKIIDPVVILRAGVYNEEIKQQLHSINPLTKII